MTILFIHDKYKDTKEFIYRLVSEVETELDFDLRITA